MKDEYGALMQ